MPLKVIGEQKLSNAAAPVTFTLADYTIPSGTRHLAMIWNARATTGGTSPTLQINNDGGANYNRQRLSGTGATADAGRLSGQIAIDLLPVVGLPATASVFGSGMVLIPHYANTANHKAVLSVAGANESEISAVAGRWASTAAITRLDLLLAGDTFVANSIFLLCVVDEDYLIEEFNLSADGTVTFDNGIPTSGDLVGIGHCRTDRAATSDDVDLSMNSDVTDANYARQRLSGSSATAAAVAAADRALIEGVPGDSATANAFGAFVVSISQHANGVKQPHILAVSGYHETSGPTSNVAFASGRRANIAAYTSLLFAPGGGGTNFKSGSLFSLYHVPKRTLDSDTLTVDTATITHTVPSGYEALVESVFARSDVAAATDPIDVAFNNDTTAANYDGQALEADGASVAAGQSAASRRLAFIPGASAAANVFGGGVALIPAYTETDRHKHLLVMEGAADDILTLRSNRWENTAAITEIDLTPGTGPNFEGN